MRVNMVSETYRPNFNDPIKVGALAENSGMRAGVKKVIADLRRDCSDLPYLSSVELERYINDTIRELEGLL